MGNINRTQELYTLQPDQTRFLLRNVANIYRRYYNRPDLAFIPAEVVNSLVEFAGSSVFSSPYGHHLLHGAVVGPMDARAEVAYALHYPRTQWTFRKVNRNLTTEPLGQPIYRNFHAEAPVSSDAVATTLLTMVVPSETDRNYYLMRQTHVRPFGTGALDDSVPIDGNVINLQSLEMKASVATLKAFMPGFQTTGSE